MSDLIEVKVPDIGGYKNVPVIEVLVKPGDKINAEDLLITLESDKATVDVPAPAAGIVCQGAVQFDDLDRFIRRFTATLIMMLERRYDLSSTVRNLSAP